MPITVGSRIGPYEILSAVGAGGMGEVWRARDARLDRDVAIKVLPASYAKERDFLCRFETEAKAASALNHPNIVTIHDIGSHEDAPYILMELVDGQTLRELLGPGPPPLKKTLEIAAQAAEGLAAAHAHGIVHRDLKPENLMVTKSGIVKILDFGLARPMPKAVSAEDRTVSATEATAAGTILGTVGYMSPEQVRGEPVDFRSDQFSLGSVIHEMLTGARPWRRGTSAETLVAILREEPAKPPPGSPAALGWILDRCLAKDPEERYGSTRDLARDLRQVSAHLSDAVPSSAARVDASAQRSSPWRAGNLATLAAGLAVGAAAALLLVHTPDPKPPVPRYLTYSGRDGEPSFSPDGRFVTFTSERGGARRIWLKQLADGSEVPLTAGTDRSPRFTPDGAAVLFTHVAGTTESIYRVPTVGGEARRVIENGAWPDPSPDGRELAFLRAASRQGVAGFDLVVAAAGGGSERLLHHVDGLAVSPPRWSADGRYLSVSHSLAPWAAVPFRIAIVPRGDVQGGVRELTPAGDHGLISAALWVNSGREILYAQLDPGYFSTSGKFVLENLDSGKRRVVYRGLNLGPQLDLAGPGRIVYEALSPRANLQELPLLASGAADSTPRAFSHANSVDRQPFYSLDGQRIVFTSNREGNMDIWELTASSGKVRRLTDSPADDWDPFLTRDGKHLLWSSKRSGHYEIWIANADGTDPRQLTHDGEDAENPTVGPDGQGGEWVYYGAYGDKNLGIWRIRMDGSGAARVRAGTIRDPAISPDGKYVAFNDATSTDTYRLRVARASDGELTKFLVETSINPQTGIGGARLRWMPDGRSLVFGGTLVGRQTGLWLEGFEPDRDTTATRRQAIVLPPDVAFETFAVSPDGRRAVLSVAEQPSDLVLVDGVDGVAPAKKK